MSASVKFRRLLALIPALLLAAGCATVDLPAATEGNLVREEDEKNLWAQSEEISDQIRSSRMLYADEELSAYVNSVARGLFPAEIYDIIPFSVSVVKDPRFNAFALPNGHLFIHTGLLARMENEAQLATLLGHEMTHSTHRHSVRSLRNLKNKSAFFSVVSFGGADYSSLLGSLGFLAAVSGYSQDLEREADAEGLKLIVAAGYDPRESPRLFEHLQEDLQQEKVKEPFFFGSHPRLRERIANYRQFLAEHENSGGSIGEEPFLSRINRLRRDNAEMDLTAGRFTMAGRGLDRYLERNPEDAMAYCLKGQLGSQAGGENGEAEALKAYQRSIELDPGLAEPHKGIGMIRLKEGDRSAAARHLARYLELKPDAKDRAYMEQYLKQLSQDGGE